MNQIRNRNTTDTENYISVAHVMPNAPTSFAFKERSRGRGVFLSLFLNAYLETDAFLTAAQSKQNFYLFL